MTSYGVIKAYSTIIFLIQVLLKSLCMRDGTEEREAQKRTKNVLNNNKMPGLNHPKLYWSTTSAQWPPCLGDSLTALTPAIAVPRGFISALHFPELKLLLPLSLCAVHRPCKTFPTPPARSSAPRPQHAAALPRRSAQQQAHSCRCHNRREPSPDGPAPRPARAAVPAVSRIGAVWCWLGTEDTPRLLRSQAARGSGTRRRAALPLSARILTKTLRQNSFPHRGQTYKDNAF